MSLSTPEYESGLGLKFCYTVHRIIMEQSFILKTKSPPTRAGGRKCETAGASVGDGEITRTSC